MLIRRRIAGGRSLRWRLDERRKPGVPERKPAAPGPLPKGVDRPKDGGASAGSNDRADQHVAWIMDAVVNPREADNHRQRQHEIDAFAIISEGDDRA